MDLFSCFVMFIILLLRLKGPLWFCNHLVEEERLGLFAFR